MSRAKVEVKGGSSLADLRPTYDQLYLAEKIEGDSPITPAVIQRFNGRYGIEAVVSSMRVMHGFCSDISRPVPYLKKLLEAT